MDTTLAHLTERVHSLSLILRGLGHGLEALGQRVARIEHEAAGLRALSRFLAAQRARREPEPVAPIRLEAA